MENQIQMIGQHEPDSGHVLMRAQSNDKALVVQSVEELRKMSEYTGNVILLCDVKDVSVTVFGNVTVKGSVHASSIICLGQLSVQNACSDSTLYARGNISAVVVRQCDLFAEQSIIIQRQSIATHLQAASSIHAAHAVVTGGCASAYDRVELRNLHSCPNSSTTIRVGDHFLRRRKEAILRKRMMTADRDVSIKEEVAQVYRHSADDANPSSPGKACLLRVEKELSERLLTAAIARSQYEEFQLSEGCHPAGIVRIHGTVDANVELFIGGASLHVPAAAHGIDYFLDTDMHIKSRELSEDED